VRLVHVEYLSCVVTALRIHHISHALTGDQFSIFYFTATNSSQQTEYQKASHSCLRLETRKARRLLTNVHRPFGGKLALEAPVDLGPSGMAKKKKSQLKPIARGFATTSIAKKVIPLDEEPETPHSAGSVDEEKPTGCKGGSPTNGNPVLVHEDEFDPEKAEEQSLQNLVDKLQDRTEKEVTRTMKVCIIVVIARDQRVHAILTGNRSRQTLC
jgi:hypothetical protein